jgi:hypothetical protein
MRYAIIKKVLERTSPTNGFAGRAIAAGEVVEFSDVIEVGNDVWGKIKDRDRAYVAINIKDAIYCARLTPLPDPQLIEKLIAWAKTQGFKP